MKIDNSAPDIILRHIEIQIPTLRFVNRTTNAKRKNLN